MESERKITESGGKKLRQKGNHQSQEENNRVKRKNYKVRWKMTEAEIKNDRVCRKITELGRK